MGTVLTTSSSLACNHTGVIATSGTAKLTVSGNPVLVSTDATAWTVGPQCTQKDASSGQKPCTKVVAVANGTAGKLTADGAGVVLDSISGTTDGVPETVVKVNQAGQTKLTAV